MVDGESLVERVVEAVMQGGVVAVANLRGGGEFGDEWHNQGRLTNKQNVFDDFAASIKFCVFNGPK